MGQENIYCSQLDYDNNLSYLLDNYLSNPTYSSNLYSVNPNNIYNMSNPLGNVSINTTVQASPHSYTMTNSPPNNLMVNEQQISPTTEVDMNNTMNSNIFKGLNYANLTSSLGMNYEMNFNTYFAKSYKPRSLSLNDIKLRQKNDEYDSSILRKNSFDLSFEQNECLQNKSKQDVRKLKNRIAATRCRERRKRKFDIWTEELHKVEAENLELYSVVIGLQNEAFGLHTLLNKIDPSCPNYTEFKRLPTAMPLATNYELLKCTQQYKDSDKQELNYQNN